MDSNDATILALSLGIPSATLLSIAFLLVLRIEYRQLQAWRIRNPTVPTNSPAPSPPPLDPYNGIPLEQRPPRVVAPLPHRPIPLRKFNRAARAEEEHLHSVSSSEFAPRPSSLSQKAPRLSSSSPPPQLPTITQTPLDLPHLASTPITERTAGDSTWAATYESPPLSPVTILGMPIIRPELLSRTKRRLSRARTITDDSFK